MEIVMQTHSLASERNTKSTPAKITTEQIIAMFPRLSDDDLERIWSYSLTESMEREHARRRGAAR